MNNVVPASEEFEALLASAIAQIESLRRRQFIESKLITPYQTQLHWEYGGDEIFPAWVFADLGERNVVALYCRGGHGARGCPWGINFRDSDHFGQDSGWYRNLTELVEDWGVSA